MKILYGVQTTGNGHIIRSKAMIQELRKSGHEVHTLLSGCWQKKILDMDTFQPLEQKQGLTFVVENGKMRYLKTILQAKIWQFYQDIYSYEASDYDLVITDYEPITARIAKRSNIPSIGIGHLYAFKYKVPMIGTSPLSKLIMNHYAPVEYPLGLHWHHFNQPILPPIIPNNVRQSKPPKKPLKRILVYLPFEDLQNVLSVLRPFKQYEFLVYANVNSSKLEHHIKILPFTRQGFIDDLTASFGVICNSGFTFISEALHLGKKILTKPVRGQIEQQSNALAMIKLNLGSVIYKLSSAAIEDWLQKPNGPRMMFPNVIQYLVQWINNGSFDSYQDLTHLVWQDTDIKANESRVKAISSV